MTGATVDLQMRFRPGPDQTGMTGWTTVDMNNLSFPDLGKDWQTNERRFNLATIGMDADSLYQIELNRHPTGTDALVGDWHLRTLRVRARFDGIRWYPADTMQNTDSADWSVNGNAPIATDDTNSAIKARRHDDTTEEGSGLPKYVPGGVAKMKLHTKSRVQVAPTGATGSVARTVHYRDTTGSWVQYDLPTNLSFVTGAANWQDDEIEIDLASLATPIVPGRSYQFQFTRNAGATAAAPGGADTLVGDWNAWMYGIEFY
jgi:hypothetical protein